MASQEAVVWRTAIFVDYDNLKLRGDSFLSPGDVLEAIRNDIRGTAIVQFGNLYLGMGRREDPAPIDRNKLYQVYTRGVSPIPTPSFKGSGSGAVKDLTDSSILVDITSTIYAHPEITGLCVATGDKDILPGVRKAREHGRAVRLYYRGECAAVLAAEVEWLNGDGFSAAINIEDLMNLKTIPEKAATLGG